MLDHGPLCQVVGDGHLQRGVQGPPLVGVLGREGVAPRQHQHPVLAPTTVHYTVYCTVLYCTVLHTAPADNVPVHPRHPDLHPGQRPPLRVQSQALRTSIPSMYVSIHHQEEI